VKFRDWEERIEHIVGVWKILVFFIIAFGNSETGNGKKVLGCEGFEFNFAFGNSEWESKILGLVWQIGVLISI
jgi:hypothetical protein